MEAILKRLFSVEAYSTLLDRRRAAALYVMGLGWLIVAADLLIEHLSETDTFTPLYGVLLFSGLGVYWLNRRGQLNQGVWLFIGIVLAAFFVPAIVEQHQMDVIDISFVFLMVAASGLILKHEDTIIVTSTTTVLWLLFLVRAVEFDNLYPEGSPFVLGVLLLALNWLFGAVGWFMATNLFYAASGHVSENRRAALTETSTAVAQRILTRHDMESLLRETVDLLRERFEDIYHAQIFLTDPQTRIARLRASTGEVGEALIAKRHGLEVGSNSVIGRVTLTGQPVLVSDTSSDPVHKVNELLPNTLTELAIPLRSRDGIIGALDVQSLKRNAFSSEDIDVLQALADQIAVALDNARLLQEAQNEARRAQALARASQVASQINVDFGRGLMELFRTVAVPGGYTHWWVGLLEPDHQTLKRVTAHSANYTTHTLMPEDMHIEKDHNALTEAIKLQKSVMVNNLSNHPILGEVPHQMRALFGKHLAMPIQDTTGKRVIGALLVGRMESAPNLDERDLELITTLTSQVSIAFENQRLFAQVASEQQTLQSILQAIPTGIVVVSKDNTIMLANEQAQTLLGAKVQQGASMDDAYPIYRTGVTDVYPKEELPLWQALSSGTVIAAEDLTVKHPVGTSIDLISRAAPLRDPQGNITAAVSVYQDITELRELERALQESLNETTKLYEASRVVSRGGDIPSITDAVIHQLRTLHPDKIYITLRKQHKFGETYTDLIAAYPDQTLPEIDALGLPATVLMPATGAGTNNMTFATRNLGTVPGLTTDDVARLQTQGIKALVVLPLEARDQVFGSIVGVFHNDRSFAPDERRFLLTLSDQASIALDAVLSFERTQEALRSTATLYQASRAIAEVQEVYGALQVVTDQIKILDPDRIDIVLMRTQDEIEAPKHTMVWASGEEAGISPVLPLHSDIVFDLLTSNEYFIEDIEEAAKNHNPLAAALKTANSPYKSVISLAFRAAGQPTGRLAVGFKHHQKFSEEDRQFIRILTDATAYLIENDMLFQQTQASLEETGILYQAIRAFANAQDKEGIVQAIIDYAADPAVDKAMLCLLLTDSWHSPNALMEVAHSWVRNYSVDLTGMRFTTEQFPSWEQLSTREILWVDDVMADPTLDDTVRMGYRALDIGAFAIVPLSVGGRSIGAILLGSSDPRPHTEREIRIYQSLADQAAITLENIQLYDQANRRARQLQTSARISRAANSILKLDELLPEMVDLIKEAFTYDHVQVFLVNHSGTDAMLHASTGESGRQLLAISHSLPVGSRSVIGTVTATGRPSIALDTADARVIHKPNPYLPNTRSEMAVPLITKNRVVGALDVQSNQPGAFTEDDVRVLSVLAEQLAVAIENARLFALSQSRLHETDVLYKTIRAFANVESTEGILNAIVEHALPDTIDKAMLCLLLTEDWHSPNALMEVAHSWVRGDSVDLNGMRFTAEQFPSWEQLSTDEILWVDDVMQAPTLDDTARMGYRALDIASFVIVPLIAASHSIGAIILGSSEPQDHSEEEIRVYKALADQAAITLENNQLYVQAERRALQLQTSARVSQAANSILNLEGLLPEMVDLIKASFNYDHVQIFLLSEDKQHALLHASTGEAGRQLLAIRHSLPVGSRSVIGQVTATKQATIALDTADARVVHKPNPYLPNTRSEMAIPLLIKNEIVGALDVQSNQPGAFTQDDTRVLTVLADQLAVAIENARLFEVSKQRSEEMSFLFTVTAEATASGDLNEILNRVSRMLIQQTRATVVVPYLYDEIDERLVPGAVGTSKDAQLTVNQLPPMDMSEKHVVAHAARYKTSVLVSNTQEEEYTPTLPSIKSGVYVPLMTGDRFIGVLLVESDRYSHFGENMVNLLETLSRSLSAVIQNSRLLIDLQQANERLREIDKLKTNFLAAMSHELRTPLNSIIGFSRVILKGIDGPVTDMQKQDLQTIHDSGRHLLGLVNDILDQAKIEAGKMELAHEYFDLKGVVKGVLDTAKGLTKDKPIRLHLEIDPELPNAYGDEFRTRQVILNLISNAAKFTDEGSITMTTAAIQEYGRGFIQVSVTDTGVGIRQEDFPKLFESFQQVDNSTTRSKEGTGLGLPLAKSLIELQGGRIWVESEYGIGSVFNVTIPTEPAPITEAEAAAAAAAAAAAEEKPPSSNGRAAVPAPPKLIMAVEEEMDMINLYRRYLSKEGYDIIGVTKLDDVDKTRMSYQITAIIVDVNMAGGRGWEVVEKLALDMPVIICSLNDDTARSEKLHAAFHMGKPFVQDDLLNAVRKAIPQGA